MKSLCFEQLEKIEGGGCWGWGARWVMYCAMELQDAGGGNGNFANCYSLCAAACDYPVEA